MRRAQDGDRAAYALVLRAMIPAIRSYARRRIFDEILVEDVIQDTLLTLHKMRHTYDPDRPILPWLATITSARAIDALRRSGRVRRRETTDELALAAAVDDMSAMPTEALGTAHEVERLLGVLPERQRRIVEMVKLQEMTLDDAAAEARTSVAAVKSLLHRAVASLREHGNR
jgi:RNA polymerase sigma-70 factor, ECF subfamily